MYTPATTRVLSALYGKLHLLKLAGMYWFRRINWNFIVWRRHILPHMTDVAVQQRLRKLMETDWKAEAAVLLKERLKQGGDAYVSSVYLAME
jgi:hypothetical protein